MTKEELEKEAVEYTDSAEEKKHWSDENDNNTVFTREEVEQAYIAGAEPREKQIERLSKEIDDLENMKATLESKIAEQEAQIEKMKCCDNCAKKGHICVAEEMQGKLCGKNKDKWELRR